MRTLSGGIVRVAHCVAADDAGHAYVCAPSQGAVLVVNDPFLASR
jgi:hypothetical protein